MAAAYQGDDEHEPDNCGDNDPATVSFLDQMAGSRKYP
jgi:hypothetical protein